MSIETKQLIADAEDVARRLEAASDFWPASDIRFDAFRLLRKLSAAIAPSDAAQAPSDTWELIREINGGGAEPIASPLWTVNDALRAIIHARDAGQDAVLILDENSPLVDAARAALSAPLAAQAPHDKPTPLDDETVSVIRSFVDRPGETYRGCITNRLGIGFGRALRRAIEESRVAPQAAGDAAQAPIYQVSDGASWNDTDWLEYQSTPAQDRRIVCEVTGDGSGAALPPFDSSVKAARATIALSDDDRSVINMLITMTRTAWWALDNSEEGTGDDGRFHAIGSADFDAMSDALDKLEELPDDKPGCTLGAAGKAEWALRRLLAAPVPPAAAAPLTNEQIIERCKAAGIKWIAPELPDDTDWEMGFPGSFDMVSMDEMRTLLAAQPTVAADAAAPSDARGRR